MLFDIFCKVVWLYQFFCRNLQKITDTRMAKEFNQSEYDNNLAQIAAALVRVGQKSDIFADEEIIARQLE